MKLQGHIVDDLFPWTPLWILGFLATSLAPCEVCAAPNGSAYQVGFAKVDVTPEFPIRLSGFASRMTESDGVRQKIYARAMAVQHSRGEPAVLIAVDSIGIPMAVRDEVARRLATKKKLANERFAISTTHSHSTPMLAGVLPTMFGMPVPADQQERIDRHTRTVTDRLEQAALAALDDLKPGKLSFGIGKAGFAINRRTRGGPVDHDLPVMIITGDDGKIRGVFLNYACHCVVLSDNKMSGDWAGCASEDLEKKHPGSVALVAIGCGADSNPECGVTGDKFEFAQQYGREIAAEVERLQGSPLTEISGDIRCQLDTIKLDLQPVPSRDEWAKRTAAEGAEGYYARVQIERLDRGEKLPTQVAYPVQTWKFGNSLAAVFLPGEVVVDYALRLKKEFDSSRLCVNAYSNDMPAYIPSERVLAEGGYEGGGAMLYYSLPAFFAPGLEDKIIAAVARQLGDEFKKPEKQADAQSGTQGTLPKNPQESLATIKVRDDLRVDLVAAEPMIVDPVAIDFGPDGKVYVAEMHDYGAKDLQNAPPEGRITVLEDRDADGKFETATRFLDKVAMPMGVSVWRKGLLIAAAPHILNAEDTDGDGRADKVEKLFSGFSIENAQARVNGFAYGLDGWLYAACTFGGTVRNVRGDEVAVPDTDFRFKPDEGVLELETGRTQQSRVRDDWGNWFGCNNSVLCYHFPFPAQYLRRNASVVPPSLSVSIAGDAAGRLMPRGELVRFALSGPAGSPTSACGLGVYRDKLLGKEFSNNIFVCDPVHQLVHRMVPQPTGATFVGERASDEVESEFLASTDNWFRPVQVRTGPDGALWVVDMYRYVIEYSHWIPKETLDELDVYAGSTMGRIYRVLPKDATLRPFPRLDKLDTASLAAAMDTPNGWQRDMVQQMLVWRSDDAAEKPLAKLAVASKLPAVRLQALCTLALLGKLSDEQIERALTDSNAAVRRQAVRLAEPRLNASQELASAVLAVVDDTDTTVALQLACTLGETDDPRAVPALASIARRHADDAYVLAGVLTSVSGAKLVDLLRETFANPDKRPPVKLIQSLMELAGAVNEPATVQAAIDLAIAEAARPGKDRLATLKSVFAGLERNSRLGEELLNDEAAARLRELCDKCIATAEDDEADLAARVDSIQVIGRSPTRSADHARVLGKFLSPDHDSNLQSAAIEALAVGAEDDVADELISAWPAFTPALRARALNVLMSRKPWVGALLDAVHDQKLPISEIDATYRARLTEYPDDELRQLAVSCFAQGTSNRAEVVERFAKSLPVGLGDRGQAVFQKHCSVCHEFRGSGNKVGPDIAGIKDKTNDALLREILDPNHAVDQRYAEYVAVTADGRVKNGILVEETSNAITLRGQQGEQTSLLRSELDSLSSTGKSLMPEGFENQITPQNMADLLQFLATP